MANRWGNNGNGDRLIFFGSKITADGDYSHEIKRHLLHGGKAMTNLDSILKTRDIANKDLSSQSYGFSSSRVWMWQLDHKGWTPNNWCFRAVVLQKALESPLDCKQIKPINTKGNQYWIFIGRTDAEAEAPILWSPDAKGQLIRKEEGQITGEDWRQEEKERTEGEMVR